MSSSHSLPLSTLCFIISLSFSLSLISYFILYMFFIYSIQYCDDSTPGLMGLFLGVYVDDLRGQRTIMIMHHCSLSSIHFSSLIHSLYCHISFSHQRSRTFFSMFLVACFLLIHSNTHLTELDDNRSIKPLLDDLLIRLERLMCAHTHTRLAHTKKPEQTILRSSFVASYEMRRRRQSRLVVDLMIIYTHTHKQRCSVDCTRPVGF